MIENVNKILLKGVPKDDVVRLAVIVIFALIVVLSIGYVGSKMTLESRDCAAMDSMYSGKESYITSMRTAPLEQSWKGSSPAINTTDGGYVALRDCCIKTAYNCCSPGGFKNAFVDTCALTANIRQGCRCLDMAVYLVDGIPAVATSAVNDVTIKETYNSIPFGEVALTIADQAFNPTVCPAYEDPLFLSLRIMSCEQKTYEAIAGVIKEQFPVGPGGCLGSAYSYENQGVNFASTPMKDLQGRVIIMVDLNSGCAAPSALLTSSSLDEWTNISTSSPFFRPTRYHALESTQNVQQEIQINQQYLTLVMPDLGSSPTNVDFNLCKLLGCQFIGMCWQNFDSNCEVAAQYFDDHQSACVVKEDSLVNKTPQPKVHRTDPNLNTQPASVQGLDGRRLAL